MLKAFVSILRAQKKNVVIVAPTGKAALEVNGSTYFSFAGWKHDAFKRSIQKLRDAVHGKKENASESV